MKPSLIRGSDAKAADTPQAQPSPFDPKADGPAPPPASRGGTGAAQAAGAGFGYEAMAESILDKLKAMSPEEARRAVISTLFVNAGGSAFVALSGPPKRHGPSKLVGPLKTHDLLVEHFEKNGRPEEYQKNMEAALLVALRRISRDSGGIATLIEAIRMQSGYTLSMTMDPKDSGLAGDRHIRRLLFRLLHPHLTAIGKRDPNSVLLVIERKGDGDQRSERVVQCLPSGGKEMEKLPVSGEVKEKTNLRYLNI